MNIQIRGIGAIGAFGQGISCLAAAADRCPPEPGSAVIGSERPVLTAETSELSRFIPVKALRRIDHYSRMAILSACLALADAGVPVGGESGSPDVPGVIVATGMGPTAGTLEVQSPEAASTELRLSPIQFSNSVHNAAAGHISMLLGIRGPNLSINHYDMSVPLAFRTALDWLEEGRVTSVLVGGVDCLSKGLCDSSGVDREARPFLVGEGAAFFLLARSNGEDRGYPVIRDVRIGRNPLDMTLPSDALVLHSGTGNGAEWVGPDAHWVNFSSLYGMFPSSMALDLAMAALILQKGPISTWNKISGKDFRSISEVCCVNRGVAGDFGMILAETAHA